MKRSEISNEFKWDIEALYKDIKSCEADYEKALKISEEIKAYQGRLGESSETLLEALNKLEEVEEIFENAFIFTHMRRDEDNKVPEYVALYGKAISYNAQIENNISFFNPELLSLDEVLVKKYLSENPKLLIYSFKLEDMFREKAHILSQKEEAIMASLGEVLNAPQDIYIMLTDAEFVFGKIKDEDGNEVDLTHGNYIQFLSSYNREVRKAAFETLYTKYKEYINTISTAYNTNVKTTCINAKLRKYPTARNAALSSGNIPESVYDNLVKVVHEYLPTMYEYVDTRKKLLGVDDLAMYDAYVPLIKLPKKEYEFDEAFDLCKKGLQVLGKDYLDNFEKARTEKWIDIYENEGKTSGAYSTSGYHTKPYILLNYTKTLDDVFTLVHEMGHSMNSYLTNHTQPFLYHDYSIFTAEVCSTVNESILMRYLLDNTDDVEIKKYLLNHYLEEFRTTLFRQTMFAEFEDWSHKEVEAGNSLTSDILCKKYEELNTLYFGPSMNNTEYIKYEWARIPHFYRDFYVYQYATGFSAATAISRKLLSGGEKERADYIKFLSAGYSDYPIETLKYTGIDMSTEEPVRLAMEVFKGLVEEFKALI